MRIYKKLLSFQLRPNSDLDGLNIVITDFDIVAAYGTARSPVILNSWTCSSFVIMLTASPTKRCKGVTPS